MKRRFIHESPRRPVGGVALGVKRDDGKTTTRLTAGAQFQWLGRTYYVGKGGELRRLYK